MFRRLWKFFGVASNREIASWLGGCAVVVAAGIWTVFVYVSEHDDSKSAPAAPAAPAVSQSGTGIASGRDTTINGPVNFGLDEKKAGQQISAAQKPMEDKLERLAAEVARQKGVEVAPLRAILIKLGEAGVRDDDIAQRLGDKADELVKLRREIARLRQGPAELASFGEQAQARLAAGDLDGARGALVAGRTAARSLREQSARYETDFIAQAAQLDQLQLAYRSAAAKYAEAATLIAPVDPHRQWEFVLSQGVELFTQGEEFGDNGALADAISVYGTALSLAPHAERPLDWATTQNNLGVALWRLGERETATTHLEAAIVAFHDALRTADRAPLDWAMTQNNLGAALATLGDRETGTARSEEAVAAYRAALTVYTRDRVPLDWAMTQNNLGVVLRTLGEREAGTARLDEAVAAFRAALQERTRDRVPLDWAATQANLGNALIALGVRENGTARLDEAVAAIRASLTEYTRTRVPLDWAGSESNLGAALQTIGERTGDVGRLKEAVDAYHEALTERTRDRVPLDWATTQNNLANALASLGVREDGTAHLEEAVAADRAAIDVAEAAGAAPAVAMYRANLGRTAAMLAARQK